MKKEVEALGEVVNVCGPLGFPGHPLSGAGLEVGQLSISLDSVGARQFTQDPGRQQVARLLQKCTVAVPGTPILISPLPG